MLKRDAWKKWEKNDRMLPEGFPFPVRNEYRCDGINDFWIFDYDLDGDFETDLRVWYVITTRHYSHDGTTLSMEISRNPFKVEKLSLGYVPVVSKIDFRLCGCAEEIQRNVGGKIESSFP